MPRRLLDCWFMRAFIWDGSFLFILEVNGELA